MTATGIRVCKVLVLIKGLINQKVQKKKENENKALASESVEQRRTLYLSINKQEMKWR